MTVQEQIIEYTNFIHHKMAHILTELLAEKGLSPTQMSILSLVYESGTGMRISQLSRKLGVTDSNTSAICQRMEKDGLVVRQRSQEDQRVVVVTTTPKAVQLINDFREEMLQINKLRMACLSPQQQEQILASLKVIAELL